MIRQITRMHGYATALIAVECSVLAAASLGGFELSYGDLRKRYQITPNTAKAAFSALQNIGFLEVVGAGKRGAKVWKLAGATVSTIDTVKGGYIDRDFKGCQFLIQSDLSEDLKKWGLRDDEINGALHRYPAAWIALKLEDCAGRFATATNPARYVTAVLERITDKEERRKAVRRLKDRAKKVRQQEQSDLNDRIWQRQREMVAGFRRDLSKRAAAWWADATEAEIGAVNQAHAKKYGGLWEFRPGVCAASDQTLLEYWASKFHQPKGDAFVGCDVQADGRLIWTRILVGPSGVWLDGAGETDKTAKVPTKNAALIADAGDGNNAAWVEKWVTDLKANGSDAIAWKGGATADGGELRQVNGKCNLVHGNAKYWERQALDLIDGRKLKVRAELLTDHYDLFHGLASRIDDETAGPDDHHFDAFKMALARAKGEIA